MTVQIPKHQEVRQKILDSIKAADYEMSRIPSERKLCEIYQVSRPTIRSAIDSLTEEGILIPRRGMGTFVNHESLKQHKRKINCDTTIGIVLYGGEGTSRMNEFLWDVMEKTINRLTRDGLRILLLSSQSSGRLSAEEIASQNVSGVIWFFPKEQSIDTISALNETKIPVVCINRKFNEKIISYITVDHQLGGYLAAKHLLELGHKDILFAGFSEENVFVRERYLGFIKACTEHNIIHSQNLILPLSEHTYSDMKNYLKKENTFTAVFIAYGVLTSSITGALKDEGYTFPESISLLSYDIDKVDTLPDLTFTAVKQPMAQIGIQAAEAVIKIIENKEMVKTVLKPTLMQGNTCRRVIK
jgi:GntR family transcriptional regulator of arabinose operon